MLWLVVGSVGSQWPVEIMAIRTGETAIKTSGRLNCGEQHEKQAPQARKSLAQRFSAGWAIDKDFKSRGDDSSTAGL